MIAHGSYYSEVLKRKKPFLAVLPAAPSENTIVVVLLHGVGMDETDWAENAPLSEMANTYDVAFLCPAGENSFYTDQAHDELHGTAIGEEFIDVMRRYFSLPKDRGHTAIAGLSMGGYGACRLGLCYPERYCAIGAFSPAFIFYKRNRHDPMFERVFVRGLEGTENDCAHLYNCLRARDSALVPWMRLACGEDDPLLTPTREFYDAVKASNPDEDITLVIKPGFHDFSLWRSDLELFCAELDRRIHVNASV